jgi:hypothetical protein
VRVCVLNERIKIKDAFSWRVNYNIAVTFQFLTMESLYPAFGK